MQQNEDDYGNSTALSRSPKRIRTKRSNASTFKDNQSIVSIKTRPRTAKAGRNISPNTLDYHDIPAY